MLDMATLAKERESLARRREEVAREQVSHLKHETFVAHMFFKTLPTTYWCKGGLGGKESLLDSQALILVELVEQQEEASLPLHQAFQVWTSMKQKLRSSIFDWFHQVLNIPEVCCFYVHIGVQIENFTERIYFRFDK